ncbi:MAG: hypothetical protein LBF27_31410 [Sphingobacterium sp.]|jgi:hypothetical protein|nr:hypothetical protein [Sphingobacterium sp.]
MKTIFLLLLLSLCVSPAQAKPSSINLSSIRAKDIATNRIDTPLYNLFYLSKYMAVKNLDPVLRKKVYEQLSAQTDIEALRKLNNDLITSFIDSVENKSIAKLKEDLISSEKSKSSNIRNSLGKDPNLTKLDELKDKLTTQKKNINILQRFRDTLALVEKVLSDTTTTTRKFDIDLKLNSSLTNDNDIKKFFGLAPLSIAVTKDSMAQITINFIPRVNTDSPLKSSITEIADLNKKLDKEIRDKKTEEDKSKGQIKSLATDIAKDYIKKTRPTESADLIQKSNENENENQNVVSMQIDINTQIQNAQRELSYTGMSLPTESQLIDAMAIFLAKRAKQEAAIWFMDQLRDKIENPLVYDAFPETYKLLENLDDFRVANFGKSWRYAIANDFVNMPVHLANSPWIKSTALKNKAEDISTYILFGRDLQQLLMGRYSYRDIIRQFYLNYAFQADASKNAKSEQPKSAKAFLSDAFSLLYMVTNELFTLQSSSGVNNFRLLSYEEINSMNTDQWQIWTTLVEHKYNQPLSEWLAIDNTALYACSSEIKTWLGKTLISMGQLDKINREYQNLRSKDKLDPMDPSFPSVWKVLLGVVNTLEAKHAMFRSTNGSSTADFHAHSSDLEIVISIFEDIQSRNFSSGIRKTLDFINAADHNSEKSFNFDFRKNNFRYEVTRLTICNANDEQLTLEKCKDKPNIWLLIDNKEHTMNNIRFDKLAILSAPYRPEKTNGYKKWLDQEVSSILEGDSILRPLHDRIAKHTGLNDPVYTLRFIKLLSEFNNEKTNVNELSRSLIRFMGERNFTLHQEKQQSAVNNANNTYSKQLLQITSFFSDVLAATDAEQIANVIDSYALPPTSYKLKRKMGSSWDLNAYVGAYGGLQVIPKRYYSSLSRAYVGGITAPIGISYDFAWGKQHFGVFTHVVDLGNIVNHYLVSGDSTYTKNAHFSEIFSLGLHLHYDIPHMPLVAFAGVKGIPLKSEEHPTLGRINDRLFDAYIIQVGLKIDIPLLNLWSRERKSR